MTRVPYRDQLADLRNRYGNRRTVASDLLDDALRLVDATVTDQRHKLDTDLAVHLARHETQLAEAERQHGIQLARVEDRLARSEARVRQLEAARTNLRETRETIDDGVLVKISAPRAATWEGKESNIPRPWTLGELDTVIYRLRLGGGTDDTEVRIKHDYTEATIPHPEMVLEAPAKKPELPVARTGTRWWSSRSSFATAGAVALVVIVYGVLALVGAV
jgi:hypothetical protein